MSSRICFLKLIRAAQIQISGKKWPISQIQDGGPGSPKIVFKQNVNIFEIYSLKLDHMRSY